MEELMPDTVIKKAEGLADFTESPADDQEKFEEMQTNFPQINQLLKQNNLTQQEMMQMVRNLQESPCPLGTATIGQSATSSDDCLVDTDEDGTPDETDNDDDNDGVNDTNDAFPTNSAA